MVFAAERSGIYGKEVYEGRVDVFERREGDKLELLPFYFKRPKAY